MPKLIWEKKLQEAVKRQQRFGWSVRNMRGKVFVQRYYPDINKKVTATLPIMWEPNQELNVLTHGMKDEEKNKNKKDLETQAKKRIKTGLILNEFGQKNNINVTEQEIQAEVQKQLRMMPGQEKMVMDFYQKNPSALASLRGTVYEEKNLNLIKEKGKANKKEISKDEAEKILKEAHKHGHGEEKKETKKKSSTTSAKEKKSLTKKAKSKPTAKKIKKVSKK